MPKELIYINFNSLLINLFVYLDGDDFDLDAAIRQAREDAAEADDTLPEVPKPSTAGKTGSIY